jgi:hypothetical protein
MSNSKDFTILNKLGNINLQVPSSRIGEGAYS